MKHCSFPKYLYKYKSIQSITDLDRVADIIKNNRIYIPTRKQLNDPLEGKHIPEISFGIAGSWQCYAKHQEHPIIQDVMDKYRILSLSAKDKNLQMWAHYTGNYSGVCIEFKTNGIFGKAKPVKYISQLPYREKYAIEPPMKKIKYWVKKGYFYKSMGWKYEKEYRILSRSDQNYIHFEDKTISSVVIGHNISETCRDYLYYICKERSIPVYCTWIDDYNFSIHFVNIEAVVNKCYLGGEDILNYEKGKKFIVSENDKFI